MEQVESGKMPDSVVLITNGCNACCVGMESHPHVSKGSKVSNCRLGKSQFSSAAKEETVVGIVGNKEQNRNSHSAAMINP